MHSCKNRVISSLGFGTHGMDCGVQEIFEFRARIFFLLALFCISFQILQLAASKEAGQDGQTAATCFDGCENFIRCARRQPPSRGTLVTCGMRIIVYPGEDCVVVIVCVQEAYSR